MYYILTLATGQPLILYQEKEKVFLYTITSGRVNSRGLLFDDYKENMDILDNHYLCYKTINNQSKFYEMVDERFIELFTLPSNVKVFNSNKDVFIFYEDHQSIYCIKCSTFNKSSLLLKGIKQFDMSAMNNEFILYADDVLYKVSLDSKLTKMDNNENQINILQEELNIKNKEIAKLKDIQNRISEQYNELANYAGKLQDELRKHRYTK